MTFARLTTRVAAGGAVAALAAAGLVGATTTSASAAPVTSSYTCTIPTQGDKTLTVSVDIALLPPTGPAGGAIAPGLLSFKSVLTVPQDVAVALSGVGVNGAKSDDFSAAFGTALNPKAPVVWNQPGAANPDGSVPFSGQGSNAAFQLPKAGTYDVSMPKSFSLIPTNNGQALPFSAPCTSTAPAKIGSITLEKQNSKTKASAPKAAKVGKPVSVKVKVTNDQSKNGGVLPSGKFIVKDGKKKVGKGTLDAKGQAKAKVKLGVGTHSLTVIYKGDDFTNKSTSKAKTVKVTK